MLEFVGIDDGSNGLNSAIYNVEFHNADELILLVQEHCPRLTVDFYAPDSSANGLAFDEQTAEQPRDAIPSTNRVTHRGRLASSISVKHGIIR